LLVSSRYCVQGQAQRYCYDVTCSIIIGSCVIITWGPNSIVY